MKHTIAELKACLVEHNLVSRTIPATFSSLKVDAYKVAAGVALVSEWVTKSTLFCFSKPLEDAQTR